LRTKAIRSLLAEFRELRPLPCLSAKSCVIHVITEFFLPESTRKFTPISRASLSPSMVLLKPVSELTDSPVYLLYLEICRMSRVDPGVHAHRLLYVALNLLLRKPLTRCPTTD
jgi:hypothetical protein